MQSALGQVVGSDLVRQPSQSLSLSVRHRDRTFVHAHYSACHHTGGGALPVVHWRLEVGTHHFV